MNDLRTAAQQALNILDSEFTTVEGEFCRWCDGRLNAKHNCKLEQTITALRAALAQQAEPDAYGYASRLAVALWEKHYKDIAPQWKPLDDLVGVLTQIDNMTSGLTRLAQQAEPVEPVGTFLVTGNEFCGAPPAPYATWGDALASMFAAGTVQGLRISALAQQAEPVEPVAWAFRHSDGTYHDPSATEHSAGMVPLYPPPPQRKPLTEEDIERICMTYQSPRQAARAVERAHGITDPQIADHLARYGIPMPEGDPK